MTAKIIELYPIVIKCADCNNYEWVLHTLPESNKERVLIDYIECAHCGNKLALSMQWDFRKENA